MKILYMMVVLYSTALPAQDAVSMSSTEAATSTFQIHKDGYGIASNEALEAHVFPAFSATLAYTEKGGLLSVNPTIEDTGHPLWDIVILEGYSEPENHQVISFGLVEKNANCIHYGTINITGLDLDTEGTQPTAFKIESRNCFYFQFTATGTLDLQIARAPEGDAVPASAWNAADALPIKPIEPYLVRDYPSLKPIADQPDLLAQQGLIGDQMTQYGAVLDGVHYTGECGLTINCDTAPMPSYSLAKSIGASLGLMRLEKLYPGTRQALLSDYVPACKNWDGVTFEDLLNMSSGHFVNRSVMGDENNLLEDFFVSDEASTKTQFSCDTFPQQEDPGQRFVYRTSDTWLLSVAMQAYWREKSGSADADLFNDLLVPIYQSLGMGPVATQTQRVSGIPLLGYGLFFTPQDIAVMAHALANKDDRLVEHLDPEMFKRILQHNEIDTSLSAPWDGRSYEGGFWVRDLGAMPGCKPGDRMPYLIGISGTQVMLMPSGDVYYYFSDSQVFSHMPVIEAINRVRPICKRKSAS